MSTGIYDGDIRDAIKAVATELKRLNDREEKRDKLRIVQTATGPETKSVGTHIGPVHSNIQNCGNGTGCICASRDD